MTNPDWNLQVKIGRGRSDTGAHHRAIEVARQLLAIGRWPNHRTRSSSSTRLVTYTASCNYPGLALITQTTM